jgi:hypothetical protein
VENVNAYTLDDSAIMGIFVPKGAKKQRNAALQNDRQAII